MRNHQELEEIARYYETHDTSSELEKAVWDDTVAADPMVTTSLRLPKPIMDAVRKAAAQRGVRPTQLMRDWIEARIAMDESSDETAQMTRAVMDRLPGVIAAAYDETHPKSA